MKTIEIRFCGEINDHVNFKDIENFLYHNFQNYCNVTRVDLFDYKEEQANGETKYFDEYGMETDVIPF